MRKSEFFNIDLPKWPGLIVVGEKVTLLQAAEILIRTDSLRFSSNDHEFSNWLFERVYGIKSTKNIYSIYDFFDDDPSPDKYSKAEKLKEEIDAKYGKLNLYYLTNSQIVSCWIGGPHGWCNWNGDIFCNTFNIGKYPTIEDVYCEWVNIAIAFPFLTLKAQLLNKEIGEADPIPVIQFNIKNGKVKMSIPTKLITSSIDDSHFEKIIQKRFSTPYSERGCTHTQVDLALIHVEKLIKQRETIAALNASSMGVIAKHIEPGDEKLFK